MRRRIAAAVLVSGMAATGVAVIAVSVLVGIFVAAAAVTLFVLTASPFGYFLKGMRDEDVTRNRTSSNLAYELEGDLDALDGSKFPMDLVAVEIDGRQIHFMKRDLNHDIYGSQVFSGNINFLGPGAQQLLQNISRQIKSHNSYLAEALRISREKREPYPKEAHHLFVWLYENEAKLRKDIPLMLDILRRGS